jgi:hypothetical protein
MTAAVTARVLSPRFTLFRESRREARYPARLLATWVRAGGPRPLWIREVSFSGFAAESEAPLELRSLLRGWLVLPTTGLRFDFHAMPVHRLDAAGHGRLAYGMMLYALDRDARAVWGRMVQHVRGDARA